MTVLLCSGHACSGLEELAGMLVQAGLTDLASSEAGARLIEALGSLPGKDASASSPALDSSSLINSLSEMAESMEHAGLLQHPALLDAMCSGPAPDAAVLLFYCSPAQALGAMVNGKQLNDDTIDDALDTWQIGLESMLAFFRANPEKCLLVNVTDASCNPAKLVEAVANLTRTSLEPPVQLAAERNFRERLFEYISDQITARRLVAQAAYADAKLQSTLLGDLESLNSLERLGQEQRALDLWNAFRSGISDMEERLRESSTERENLEKRVEEFARENIQLKADLGRCANEATANEEAIQDLDTLLASANGKLERLQKERTQIDSTLEINQLQIKQLQEEVEYYFEKVLEQESRTSDPHDAYCKTLEVFSIRDVEDETHAEVLFSDLRLSDGRLLKELRCKIVAGPTRCGLEFRPCSEDDNILPWGQYSTEANTPLFPLLISAQGQMPETPMRLIERLSTGERTLVTGAASALSSGCHYRSFRKRSPDLTDLQLHRILSTCRSLDDWRREQASAFSFDNCSLLECYEIDGYEHLWIRLEGALNGPELFDAFDFKLVLQGARRAFPWAEAYSLEFREFGESSTPFRTWPPATSDEHGHFLRLTCLNLEDKPYMPMTSDVQGSDRNRVYGLMLSLPRIVDNLANSGDQPARDWEDWRQVANTLQSVSIRALRNAHGPLLRFREQFQDKDYAHLAFDMPTESGYLTVKLQARRIDSANGDMTPAIEFRSKNGADLPFRGTRFQGKDEHGSFVVIAGNATRSRLGRNPSRKSHAEDYALTGQVLRALSSQLDDIALENAEGAPSRESWRGICKDLRAALPK